MTFSAAGVVYSWSTDTPNETVNTAAVYLVAVWKAVELLVSQFCNLFLFSICCTHWCSWKLQFLFATLRDISSLSITYKTLYIFSCVWPHKILPFRFDKTSGLVMVKTILNKQCYFENSTVWGKNQQKFEINSDWIE